MDEKAVLWHIEMQKQRLYSLADTERLKGSQELALNYVPLDQWEELCKRKEYILQPEERRHEEYNNFRKRLVSIRKRIKPLVNKLNRNFDVGEYAVYFCECFISVCLFVHLLSRL